VQNLEVKKINDEKKTALAAQFAAEKGACCPEG
jgi:hypothetical protein